MNKTTNVLAISALALLFAATAHAGPGGRGGQAGEGRGADRNQIWDKMIEKLDANDDGKLSLEEFKSHNRMFEKADANDDGTLSSDELSKIKENRPRAARMLERLDRNHDGTITKGEIGEAGTEHFRRLDSNNDGQIVKGEFLSFKPGKGDRETHED